MRTIAIGLVLGTVAGSLGCAEKTLVHSVPSGAHVSWDGRPVGTTPTPFVVQRSE